MISGFTLGHDKIRKLSHDKRGLTLIEKKRSELIRVVPQAEAVSVNKKAGSFQNCCMKGVPPDKAPHEVIGPLMDRVSTAEGKQPPQVSEIFGHPYRQTHYPFRSFVWGERGKAVIVEKHGRARNGKKVCIPCAEKSKHA